MQLVRVRFDNKAACRTLPCHTRCNTTLFQEKTKEPRTKNAVGKGIARKARHSFPPTYCVRGINRARSPPSSPQRFR